MAEGETGTITGTKDKDYNIIWFTEACLSNVLRLETYVGDAEREGDSELADFFRRVLENDSARGYYVIGNGANSTVAELTEAAAVAVGAPGAVAGSDEEARTRLGDYFAEVLLLDQSTTAAKARTELDWRPSHSGLVEEFRHGSYRN